MLLPKKIFRWHFSLDRLHVPSKVYSSSPQHLGMEALSMPPLPTLLADPSPEKVAQGHQRVPLARGSSERKPQSGEGVKAASLLRDFSVICTHVMGIRTVGGSASLWQSFRPMAQHLTGSESPLIQAVFKFN